MDISEAILENIFLEFSQFIQKKDQKPFTRFQNSTFFDEQENYKKEIFEAARRTRNSTNWSEEDVGKGYFLKSVIASLTPTVYHKGRLIQNNLVDWRQIDSFSKISKNTKLEQALFNFFTNKNSFSNKDAFHTFIDEGLNYQLTAYLFFTKDPNAFLPIAQEKFDDIFEKIGIHDFKTSRNASWENYRTYLQIIKQVHKFLRKKDPKCDLLDAHSFLWTVGSINSETLIDNKPEAVKILEQTEDSVSDYLSEEDDEAVYPEGKEFYRLHLLRERDRSLVMDAKRRKLRNDPDLCCEVCGFSFFQKYGPLGLGFIEAHHKIPVSTVSGEFNSSIEDLAMVCSNCHRMLHREINLTIEELKSRLK